jgi:heptosyltransferase-1
MRLFAIWAVLPGRWEAGGGAWMLRNDISRTHAMPLPADPQRILIIRPSALGDVCRTVPVVVSLRRRYRQSQIDWLVQDAFAAAIEAHPDLSDIVTFPRARFAHWWRSPARLLELMRWIRNLQQRRYDLVLDCQGLGRSGLMSWLTGAPQRVGLRSARELAWLGYTLRVEAPEAHGEMHTVDEMLLLIEALGIEPRRDMRLYVSPPHQQWWTQRQHSLGIVGQSYAVLAPSSRWPGKNWPIERFIELIEPLQMRGFARVVVIGATSELEQTRPLIDATTSLSEPVVIDLVGQSSIGQTMAVVAGADLVIANDSAPLHIAVGLGRPCVGLFGPTDPARVGPYRMEHAVVRGWREDRRRGPVNFKDASAGGSLMRLISHVSVLQRVDQVLSMGPPPTLHDDATHDTAIPQASADSGAAAQGSIR